MRQQIRLLFIFCLLAVCLYGTDAMAQVQQPPGVAPTLSNIPQRDTSTNKTNNSEWKNQDARITFSRAYSEVTYIPDTGLHTFHRRLFVQPWYRNLGNHGSAAYNSFFTPEYRVGPTLGYHVYDRYRFNADSVYYYNTNNPYSFFRYQLGSKLEQTAQLMHTQNIRPNWNVAVQYQKLTSPGNFLMQRTNHDNAFLTTNYQGNRLRYQLYGAIVYNKEQQDENGGIINEGQLDTVERYGDRRTIPVRFGGATLGSVGDYERSGITNTLRDYSVLLQHSYNFGPIDTLYSEDSTRYTFQLNPRFGISHRMQISSEKHVYKDIRSDSLNYVDFFNQRLRKDGKDSVLSEQKWRMIDNRVMLNSFLGKRENLLSFSAGLGNRIDHFNTHFALGNRPNDIISNYVAGELKKEIRLAGQWYYNASAQFYLTGEAAGNTSLYAEAGKDLGGKLGEIRADFQQQVSNAPYNYTVYQNQYDTVLTSFNKESVTRIAAAYTNYHLKAGAGIRTYLVGNYIHLNEKQQPDQSSQPFNITQLWLQKMFRLGKFVLDNEVAYQQIAGDAPVNLPALLGKHQLSLETNLFKSALTIATGIEIRYHSNFAPAAYSPYFNRFYYQTSYQMSNTAETSVFFNFRIKRFRAYLMGDQLQKLVDKRNAIATPGYPMPDFAFRVGFTWTLIN